MTDTLETLRADFEAAKVALTNVDRAACPGSSISNDFYKRVDADEWATLTITAWSAVASAVERVNQTAHVYLLARDYGPEAAMLYKLSDGNIDPRPSISPAS